MTLIKYEDYELSVREDLTHAHETCWSRLSQTGTWLEGSRKVHVAAEVRNARTCSFCAEQKEAISPNSVTGSHSNLGKLSDTEVEIIHRIVSDPGRLSKKWYQDMMSMELREEEYIEIVGVIAMVMIIDTFTFALGMPDHDLPKPESGKPSFYRSSGAKVNAAWIPIVEPEDATSSDGDLYPNPKVGYILRALSAVPKTKFHFWDLMHAQYLPEPIIYQFDRNYRAITRAQMEVVAARVSALHQCLY